MYINNKNALTTLKEIPFKLEKEWLGVLVISKNCSFLGESEIQYFITSARSWAVVLWIPCSSLASSPLGVI